MDNEIRYLTVTEAARLMRVVPMTIYRRISAGKLSARKVGKGFLIPATEIERLCEPVEPPKPEA